MAPAFSEARNAAVAATSASRGERRVIRIWSRFSIRPWKAASSSNFLSTAASFSRENVSGSPAVQMPTTRTPRSPISAARFRMKVSRSEEHTSELQSRQYLVCRLLLEKKKHTKAEAKAHYKLLIFF